MKRAVLSFFLLLAVIGIVSADTWIGYPTNSTNGMAQYWESNRTWEQIRNGSGNYVYADPIDAEIYSWSYSPNWTGVSRGIIWWDTSTAPDTAVISSAQISIYKQAVVSTLGNLGVGISGYTIDGDMSAEDFDNFGNTRYATDILLGSMGSGYINWTGNSYLLSNISTTGNTSIMIRIANDIDNSAPAWSASKRSLFRGKSSTGEPATPPILEFVYSIPDTTPPQSITGLTNTSVSCNQLFFNWTNPLDSDYGNLMVWRNNTALTNLSNTTTGVSWTGLPESTDITFSSKTCDLIGNCNASYVNMTRTTVACGVAPVAAFSANETEICIDDHVQFTDESTNTPTAWHWILTGGWDSHDQNPVHQFDAEGLYSVNLTASNDYGSDYE
jgi:hypothetical protein